jgi:hypothetical protein
MILETESGFTITLKSNGLARDPAGRANNHELPGRSTLKIGAGGRG